jgi:AcrR family transcriptional regulator
VQRVDERKRREIVKVASRLFATRPFHQVRLEDVAAEAGIGKGTVYIYFETKEDLYCSLLLEGISGLIERLEEAVGESESSAWQALERAIGEMVAFAAQHPELFELIRSGWTPTNDRLEEKRVELGRVLQNILRRGTRRGELSDPNPALTAQFILSAVRGAMLYRPARSSPESITRHIARVLGRGIRKTP